MTVVILVRTRIPWLDRLEGFLMALISCSACGKRVSDKAPSCPKCGHPIDAGPQQAGTPSAPNPRQDIGEVTSTPPASSKRSPAVVIVVLLTLALVLIIGTALALFSFGVFDKDKRDQSKEEAGDVDETGEDDKNTKKRSARAKRRDRKQGRRKYTRSMVNLLQSVTSTVTVSSKVRNRAIEPGHLVDGDLSTAWNSSPGQIVGSWVEISLPHNVKVRTIKLTAGFTKVERKGDLFLMNHRVRKIRVIHQGRKIGDFKLDISSRQLQDIKVKLKGGDIKLVVIEVERGTKLRWREACISELEVWGFAPVALLVENQKPLIRVAEEADRIRCPSKRTIKKILRRTGKLKKNGRVREYNCQPGRFPNESWYIVAKIQHPTTRQMRHVTDWEEEFLGTGQTCFTHFCPIA